MGFAFRLGALKSGGVARFPVRVRLPAGSAGKRLLAVVDPARRHEDIDRPNNTAAVVVGE